MAYRAIGNQRNEKDEETQEVNQMEFSWQRKILVHEKLKPIFNEENPTMG